MKKFCVVIVMFCAQILFAQSDFIDDSKYNPAVTGFSVSALNYLGSEAGKTNLEVFIQVPYSAIHFVKKGFRYTAKYTLSLTIKTESDDGVVYQDIWTEELTAREFEKTQSETSFNLSRKSVPLSPDKYTVLCVLEDENSRVKERRSRKITVREIKNDLDVSDIMIISRIIRGKSGDQIIPNIENMVTSKQNELPFYFELYSAQERELNFEFVLTDNMRNRSVKYASQKKVNQGKNTIYHKIDNPSFSLGNYSLRINVINNSETKQLGQDRFFNSSYKGIPNTVIDLEKAIDQMIYIASTSAVDSIKSINDYSERLERYVKYWKRYDPTPGTDNNEVMNEYYARVDYSNNHFNSYYEGWKSDMGWIFITLGPPDNVYRQPMAMNEKPYEIWTYYDINRTFKFTDETGFGHYRLVNPQYGDWLRYRY